MIVFLIADLARQEDLRARFDANAEAVLEQYEIPAKDRALFLNRDAKRLVERLAEDGTELLRKLIPSRQFFWPGNILILRSIEPTAAGTKTPVNVVATGELFDLQATLAFTRPNVTVDATNVVVKNNGLESVMTASAQFSVTGSYNATVRNPNGQYSTLIDAITIS